MAERRLDRATVDLVRRAWGSILEGRKQDLKSEMHFTDNEGDTGLLKDVDALNTLLEPYLLAPSSFVDPALKPEDIASYLEAVLSQVGLVRLPHGLSGEKESSREFLGFSSSPYLYLQVDIDFVDSAAALLRLACNSTETFSSLKRPMPKPLEKMVHSVASAAIGFLLKARVEDRSGVRWSGFIKASNQPGMFANLFFTNVASLALYRALKAPGLKTCISAEQREEIESTLSMVVNWVASQYDPATNSFWLDEARTSVQPMGVLYALEILYTLIDPLPEEIRNNCARALDGVVIKMGDLSMAQTLQRDFFYTLPNPTGPGSMSYDDRRYIGAFLALFALAKGHDANVVNDTFMRAGDVLWQGVSDEWIDDPTGLWDDGRPLICFTQDALIGLVKFSLEGRIDVVNLPEFDLRFAIRDALRSEEVIDVVFGKLIEKARNRKAQELSRKIPARQGS